MRKVVAYEMVSLDGVAENPDEFLTAWDDEMDTNLARLIASQDAVILGRRSFDEWAAYWPTSDVQPFADFINRVTKYVVTSTALQPEWANATAIEGELAEFVRELRERSGGDIGVHASISVVRALLVAGLVDELRLVVSPVIAGSGQRPLDGVPITQFELVRSATSSTGHLLLDYRVIG